MGVGASVSRELSGLQTGRLWWPAYVLRADSSSLTLSSYLGIRVEWHTADASRTEPSSTGARKGGEDGEVAKIIRKHELWL